MKVGSSVCRPTLPYGTLQIISERIHSPPYPLRNPRQEKGSRSAASLLRKACGGRQQTDGFNQALQQSRRPYLQCGHNVFRFLAVMLFGDACHVCFSSFRHRHQRLIPELKVTSVGVTLPFKVGCHIAAMSGRLVARLRHRRHGSIVSLLNLSPVCCHS